MVGSENAFVERKVLVPITRGRIWIGLKICVCPELVEIFGDFRVQFLPEPLRESEARSHMRDCTASNLPSI